MGSEGARTASSLYRGAVAAAILVLSPLAATAGLVTRLVPVVASQTLPSVSSARSEAPEADGCLESDRAVYALEASLIDAQAQRWAYKFKRGALTGRFQRDPGEAITHADLREAYYQKLRFWSARAVVPELPVESIGRLDATAKTIQRVLGMRAWLCAAK